VFALTFGETDLPLGTNWSVTLVGTPSAVILLGPPPTGSFTRWSDGGTAVRFYVSNGSYSYSTSAAGHKSMGGNLTVDGTTPAQVPVGFTSSSSSTTGIPFFSVALLGAVIVVLLIGVAAILQRPRDRRPSGPQRPPSEPEADGPGPPFPPR
jgi:hypothetical protein